MMTADTLQEANSEALRAPRELRAQHDVKCVEIDQFKPSKLDRIRWEGCRYCGDGSIYSDLMYDFMVRGEEVGRYCKKCGRPLTEEAWAELERRINHES